MNKFTKILGALVMSLTVFTGVSMLAGISVKADGTLVTIAGSNGSYTANGVAVDGVSYTNGVKYSNGVMYLTDEGFSDTAIFNITGEIEATLQYGTENPAVTINIGMSGKVKIVDAAVFISENKGNILTLNGGVDTNNGTIANIGEYGFVSVNNSSISDNWGTVYVNKGTVVNNNCFTDSDNNVISAIIVDNYSNVHNNNGCIYTNSSLVIYNNSGSIIYENVSAAIVGNNHGCIVSNAGTVYTNYSDGEVYQNIGTIRTNEGFATLEAPNWVIMPTGNEDFYTESIKDTCKMMEYVAELIANGEIEGERTIYFTGGDSLPAQMLETLKKCPGVTFDFQCTYEGVDYHFAIKGGNDLRVNPAIPWYGPLYLDAVYGQAQ